MDYNLSLGSAGRYISSGLPGAEFNGWVNVKPFGNRSKKFGKLVVGGGFNGGHNRIDYAVATGYIGYHHKNCGQISKLLLRMVIVVQMVSVKIKPVGGLRL